MKTATLAALAALALLSPAASADDAVRACIAASTDGQTLRDQGKLLAARERLLVCARDACPGIVRAHCARWLADVDARIPSLVVRAEDAAGDDAIDARLSIDGSPSPLDGQPVRLDPGQHVVVVEGAGGARKEQRLLVVEGDVARKVTLRLPSVAAATPSGDPGAASRRVPVGAWIAGGVGVAALAGATYFGFAANGQLDDLHGTCSPHCTDAQTQAGRTDALAFDLLLGVGAAAVLGAVVWAVAFPTRVPSRAAGVRLDVEPVARGAITVVGVDY